MARARSGRAAAVAFLVLTAVGLGCGRKAPPLPPLLRMAEQTRDLKVVQTGSLAVLEWSYPQLTTAGGSLPAVEAVELWRATLPAAQEPQGTSVNDRRIMVQLLKAEGELLARLGPEQLEAATRGPRLRYEDDLTVWRQQVEMEGQPVVWYAVRTVCCGKRESAFSNIARLEPQVPPPPPLWVGAAGRREGIELDWTQEEGLGTVVERSSDGLEWEQITAEPVLESELSDPTAAQGRSWQYRLRSVRALEGGGLVLGEPGPVRVVEHPDVYPPPAPDNLVCLPEGALVRLRWSAGAKGLSYRITRSLDGAAPETLAEDQAEPEYSDTAPPLGRLVYTVQAVDAAGNESPPADCRTVIGAAP